MHFYLVLFSRSGTTVEYRTDLFFFWDFSAFNNTGRSYVEDQLVSLSMATACTTTMHDQICLVSCRHLSSLATWPASAMHSS